MGVGVVSGEFGDESREFRLLFFYELEPTSTQSSLYQIIWLICLKIHFKQGITNVERE